MIRLTDSEIRAYMNAAQTCYRAHRFEDGHAFHDAAFLGEIDATLHGMLAWKLANL